MKLELIRKHVRIYNDCDNNSTRTDLNNKNEVLLNEFDSLKDEIFDQVW